jgi:hypothetical protein
MAQSQPKHFTLPKIMSKQTKLLALHDKMFKVTLSRQFLFEWSVSRKNRYRYALDRLIYRLFNNDLHFDALAINQREAFSVEYANQAGLERF